MLNPYRVIIETVTPIVLTEFAPMFDGVVFAALSQVMCNTTAHEKCEKMKELLQFNEELGVFHASALRFVITPEQGLTARQSIHVDQLKSKLNSTFFTPNGRGERYVNILTAGGPTKIRTSKRLAYESSKITFDIVGDAARLKRLLTEAFVGVGYDAFAYGQGQIKTIEFIAIEEDISLFEEQQAKRNLPQSFCKEQGINGRKSLSPLMPPYYDHETVTETIGAARVKTIYL